uniref:Sestrinlike protein putative n=1 Tax=Albugo laibachii Nc14 TaxID=890382 RepID=F0W983_9STRA|nr:sestrinlike protein putative [Albugo laibachii Nc14]CCA18342.1 sestrinlike protein putative [Albugo laibachii Nc14]|eukprot:CCA18342.1 sestrinlike protein putative [Albugo laibachii Nc14]
MAGNVYKDYCSQNKYIDLESDAIAIRARVVGLKEHAFFQRLLVADTNLQSKMTLELVSELQEIIEQNQLEFLLDYYPSMQRLAREAPFPIIQEAFVSIIDTIQAKWPQQFQSVDATPRISYFINNQDLNAWKSSEDQQLIKILQTVFLRTGRIGHFNQLLASHRQYLKSFHSCLDSTMIRDGTLPLQWRCYIALMASAESRCNYFAEIQEFQFIVNRGDPDWIRGIDFIPEKLFQFHVLGSLLAHRPWLIKPQHIADLLSSEREDSWSVSELVHAIIVFSIYNSMCCVALGIGCAEEEDLAVFSEYNEVLENESDPTYPIQRLQSSERKSSRDAESRSNSTSSSLDSSELDIAAMERDDVLLLKRLENGMHELDSAGQEEENYDAVVDDVLDDEFGIIDEDGELDWTSNMKRRRCDTLWRFCGSVVNQYTDFDVRSQEYDVLHTEDFSWDEHCFSLVRRYFPGEAGQILEDMFNITRKLTYDYLGTDHNQNVDTCPYRMAIWYYVHRIFGICHDDYDYRQINYYLNRPTKFFVKKVACTPWKVSKRDFEHFDRTLDFSEKMHVTLIAAEARKQANLMYGLRAVMQHMR